MTKQLRSGLNAVVGLAALLLFAAVIKLTIDFTGSADVVRIADKTFNVEIADTPEERSKGLMSRLALARNHGMLFVFEDSAPRSFWNQDTLIPLDVIFINNYQVVAVEQLPKFEQVAGPITVSPAAEARYVLELNQGSGIKIGDSAEFQLNYDEEKR